MDIKQELEALHSWKAGGRGETMMSTFDYNSSHDKMFIEGFREGIECAGKWHNLEENPEDLPELNKKVLVKCNENNEITLGYYYEYPAGPDWCSSESDENYIDFVREWKEI